MTPHWFHLFAITYLTLGAASAFGIALQAVRQRQTMWIMYLVWPITALFGTGLVIALYVLDVRHMRRAASAHGAGHHGVHQDTPPFPVMVAKGALHCGAGCTLGDILAEWLAFLAPVVAVGFGWHWIFADKIFAVWILDYLFAYAFGIAFQYYTIKPMRGLSPRMGLVAAIKADTLSLTAWQIGMYGFVAFAKFVLFADVFHAALTTNMSCR